MLHKKNICRRLNSQTGFTLIEVLVAFTIVSISLVMIIRLFSAGLRASKTTCDYTRAVVHAKDKMEELAFDTVEGSGEFEDGFKWQSEVEPYSEPEESSFNLMKIKVIISWPDVGQKQKSIELLSLKAVSDEEEL